MTNPAWHRLVSRLRASLPLDRPVRVRRHRFGRPQAGDCCLSPQGYYLIRIESRLPAHEALGTLLHEFGHALAWPLDNGEEHGEWFERAMGMVTATYWSFH